MNDDGPLRNQVGTTGFAPSWRTSSGPTVPAPVTSNWDSFCARSVRHTDACHSQARKEPTGSTPKLAHVRQPRTTVVNPA